MSEMLTCSHCKKKKPTSDFHRARDFARGYQYRCMACAKAIRKAREAAKT